MLAIAAAKRIKTGLIKTLYSSSVPSDISPDDAMQELRRIAKEEAVEICEFDHALQAHNTDLGFHNVQVFPENGNALTLDAFLVMVWKTSKAAYRAKEVEKRFSEQIMRFYETAP